MACSIDDRATSRPATAPCACCTACRSRSTTARPWCCSAPTATARARSSSASPAGAPTAAAIALKVDGQGPTSSAARPRRSSALGVALVPEGRRLFPALTVEENLMLGAYRKAARAKHRTPTSISCFAAFPVLARRRHQLAGSMSGGEQQMVAVGARPDVGAQAAAGRRALGRPGAHPGQPDDRQDQGAEGSATSPC